MNHADRIESRRASSLERWLLVIAATNLPIFGCVTDRTLSVARLEFEVHEMPSLPRGVGGALSGVVHDTLMVAGGTWFTKPPHDGGVKVWTDEVFALAPGSGACSPAMTAPWFADTSTMSIVRVHRKISQGV